MRSAPASHTTTFPSTAAISEDSVVFMAGGGFPPVSYSRYTPPAISPIRVSEIHLITVIFLSAPNECSPILQAFQQGSLDPCNEVYVLWRAR